MNDAGDEFLHSSVDLLVKLDAEIREV